MVRRACSLLSLALTLLSLAAVAAAAPSTPSNYYKVRPPRLSAQQLDASNAAARKLPGALATGSDAPYTVQSCVTSAVGQPCALQPVANVLFMPSAVPHCDPAHGQAGSVSWADFTLPVGKALYVKVTTSVPGQSAANGFFVRPVTRTRAWGLPDAAGTTVSFYLGATGQFSVEFAAADVWRDEARALVFDALMLFVNPPLTVPRDARKIAPDTATFDLGPNAAYVFAAGESYDWGRDQVFKVHDNTSVYFETGAYVRARIVQTERKASNVTIRGYGTLDAHYLLAGTVGASDDSSREIIAVFGKNVRVDGVTLINTIPTCAAVCYCLNINADWAPMASADDPFSASELVSHNPPFKYHRANCQDTNMDDSPNKDFANCPTSQAEGAQVSFVKCMSWQSGQDGLNAGKFGQVSNSFVRVPDDSLKPWDSHAVYTNITIWQLTLGWPINLGWWEWDQADEGTVIDTVWVIHNHNWVTSGGWPATLAGQCVVGGIYGSGSVKRSYDIRNIYTETACSCAVALQVSKDALFRHPTPEGCVGSIVNMTITNFHADEEFFGYMGGYSNFLSGETSPSAGCTGELSGQVANLVVSGTVDGRDLTELDFGFIDRATVPGLVVKRTQPPRAPYGFYAGSNCYDGHGGTDIDPDGAAAVSPAGCVSRCDADRACDCIVYYPKNTWCWKRAQCVPGQFQPAADYQVYMKPSTPQQYTRYPGVNCYAGHGGTDIDPKGAAASVVECTARCDQDDACTCVTYYPPTQWCWKRGACDPAHFQADAKYEVYVKP